jgi:hypothetical protein
MCGLVVGWCRELHHCLFVGGLSLFIGELPAAVAHLPSIAQSKAALSPPLPPSFPIPRTGWLSSQLVRNANTVFFSNTSKPLTAKQSQALLLLSILSTFAFTGLLILCVMQLCHPPPTHLRARFGYKAFRLASCPLLPCALLLLH